MTKEYIICAAIWYKDLPTQTFLPKNLDKGVVVCGHRHGHCIDIMRTLGQLRSVVSGPDSVGDNEQGFLSNKGKFYDRFESMRLAIDAGQVEYDKLYNPRIGLFSEDLY